MKKPAIFILGFLVCWAAQTDAAVAETAAPALSPEARASFEKGLAAAGQEEWDLACEYFDTTLKADPFYAPALFNLGLARERKGQELPAMAWFYAYLEADPTASNRKDIEKELLNLEVAVEAKKRKAFEQAIEAADQLPADGSYARVMAHEGIFRAYSRIGDIKRAVALARSKVPSIKDPEARAQTTYGYTLAGSGRHEEAIKMAEGLPEGDKSFVLGGVAQNYQSQGKVDKAFDVLKSAGAVISNFSGGVIEGLSKEKRWQDAESLIPPAGTERARGLVALAKGKVQYGGDAAEAKKHLEEAAAVDQEKYVQRDILLVYAEMGDTATAERMIASIPDKELIAWDYTSIARAYAVKGDAANFERTIVKVKEKEARDKAERAQSNDIFSSSLSDDASVAGAYQSMFDHYQKENDWKNAEKYLPYLKPNPFDYGTLPRAYSWVAYQKIKAGVPDAEKLLDQISESKLKNQKEYAYATIVSLAAEDGDFENAFLWMGRVVEKEYRANALFAIAQEALKKGRTDFALENLLKNEELLDLPYFSSLMNIWLDTAKALAKEGKREEAILMLNKVEPYALKRADQMLFNALLAAYTAARDSEGVRRIASFMSVIDWIALARSFESADTADTEAYYDSVLKSEASVIPEKLAALGEVYSNGLTAISDLKKAKK